MFLALATGLIVFTGLSAAMALPSISSDAFSAIEGCGCHSSFIETWRTSMHAQALTDPLYQYKLQEADDATDGALRPYCETCHAPIAVMAGELDEGATLSKQGGEGISCDFCHQVTGRTDPIGNTSLEVAGDGVKRAQWDDAVSPVHETMYSPFHETAEFCGSCHNVNHPVNGLALEATYTEWKNGPYAAEGIVCQDCHMTPGPGVEKPNPGVAAAGGPQRDHIYIMTFAGGNVGLGDAVNAEERLQAALDLELVVPEVVAVGDTAAVDITITNVGAGHYVPTGLTEVRQMWLEVVATTADGDSEVIGRRDFGSVLEDEAGEAPVELWEAAAFAKDDRIPPKGSVEVTYELTMPADEVELTAAVYYRSASEEMAEAAGVEVPTTTMVSATQAVYGSEDVAADASADDVESDSSTGLVLIVLAAFAVVAVIAFVVMRMRRA